MNNCPHQNPTFAPVPVLPPHHHHHHNHHHYYHHHYYHFHYITTTTTFTAHVRGGRISINLFLALGFYNFLSNSITREHYIQCTMSVCGVQFQCAVYSVRYTMSVYGVHSFPEVIVPRIDHVRPTRGSLQI